MDIISNLLVQSCPCGSHPTTRMPYSSSPLLCCSPLQKFWNVDILGEKQSYRRCPGVFFFCFFFCLFVFLPFYIFVMSHHRSVQMSQGHMFLKGLFPHFDSFTTWSLRGVHHHLIPRTEMTLLGMMGSDPGLVGSLCPLSHSPL